MGDKSIFMNDYTTYGVVNHRNYLNGLVSDVTEVKIEVTN